MQKSRIDRRSSKTRARKACLRCRERKVRCDLEAGDHACSNCEFRSSPCIVKPRKNARVSKVSPSGPDSFAYSFDSTKQSTNISNELQLLDTHEPLLEGFESLSQNAALLAFHSIEDVFSFDNVANQQHRSPPAYAPTTLANNERDLIAQDAFPDAHQFCRTLVNPLSSPRHFLEDQGCFQLPASRALYSLGLLYFQYIHPNLPVIIETDFWNMWTWFPDGTEVLNTNSFSLVTIQAMCFLSVRFAPTSLVQECKFDSKQAASATFYARAKLLIDFGIERDPLRLSQASLFLTYHSPAVNELRLNSRWLALAIHYARVAQAHTFYKLHDNEGRLKRSLKRIWWCCILRDRVLPLGVRRQVQILEPFPRASALSPDVESLYLTKDDFIDEIGRSKVHDSYAQARVIEVIHLACRLALVLTDTVVLLFHTDKPWEEELCSTESLGQIVSSWHDQVKNLRAWFEHALIKFPRPVGGLGDAPKAVVLFANLLFIYCNTAELYLMHMLLIAMESQQPSAVTKEKQSFGIDGRECKKRVILCLEDILYRAQELLQFDVAQYAPISLSAYLAFPLLLFALDARTTGRNTPATNAQNSRNLEIYSRIMRLQQENHEGCDYPCEVIEKLLSYANRHSGMTQLTFAKAQGQAVGFDSTSKTMAMTWADLLDHRPRLYLRLAFHVDLAFCTSVMPQEQDYPIVLRHPYALQIRHS